MQTIGTSAELRMSLLLFAALSGHLLAIGLRQPAVVGEIIMGVILGSTLLHWITFTDTVSTTAQLGAIVLLALSFSRQLALEETSLVQMLVLLVKGVTFFAVGALLG